MDALLLHTATPAAPAANATAAGKAVTAEAPADDTAAAKPQPFSTLLALQLGAGAADTPPDGAVAGATITTGAAFAVIDAQAGDTAVDDAALSAGLPALLGADGVKTTAKAALDTDAERDVRRGRKADADTTLDPLAGLNLPGLSPLTPPPASATQPAHAGADTDLELARHTSLGAATADASGKNSAPAVTVDHGHTASSHLSDALNAARSDAAQFSRELATLQNAEGVRNAGEHVHSIDMAALSAAQAQPAAAAPAASAASAATPVQAALAAQVGTPAWNTELGQKIVWMVGDQQQVAEIHVNPPNLGPLDIKLTIDGAQTTALFTSPHSEVREAVEAALPRLREVLADSGIMLGNASVTTDTPRDGRAFAEQPPRSRGNGSGNRGADGAAEAPLPTRVISQGRGLVDLFA